MKYKCKISVVMPCYNQAPFLSEALDSVIAQSYRDWECIIVDDGSTDNSRDVAMKYVEMDNRIRYHYQDNSGPSAARNNGINLSNGEFILPLDGDDRISPKYMSLAMERFESEPLTKVVYSKARYFGLKNKRWNLKPYDYDKLRYFNMIFCSCFFRKDDILQIGGYDEDMRKGFEDWEMLLRLLKCDTVVYKIPEVCFYYRRAGNQVSKSAHVNRFEIFDYMFKKNIHLYCGEWNPIHQNHIWRRRLRNLSKMSPIVLIYRLMQK